MATNPCPSPQASTCWVSSHTSARSQQTLSDAEQTAKGAGWEQPGKGSPSESFPQGQRVNRRRKKIAESMNTTGGGPAEHRWQRGGRQEPSAALDFQRQGLLPGRFLLGDSRATPALMPGRGVLQHREPFDVWRGLGWLYFEGSCCHACGQRQWAREPGRFGFSCP